MNWWPIRIGGSFRLQTTERNVLPLVRLFYNTAMNLDANPTVQ